MRAKFGDGRLHRKIALEGHRFTPKEALDAGLVDHIVDGSTETILANAVSLGERVGQIAKEGVWGLIKVCVPSQMRRMQRNLTVRNFEDNVIRRCFRRFPEGCGFDVTRHRGFQNQGEIVGPSVGLSDCVSAGEQRGKQNVNVLFLLA